VYKVVVFWVVFVSFLPEFFGLFLSVFCGFFEKSSIIKPTQPTHTPTNVGIGPGLTASGRSFFRVEKSFRAIGRFRGLASPVVRVFSAITDGRPLFKMARTLQGLHVGAHRTFPTRTYKCTIHA